MKPLTWPLSETAPLFEAQARSFFDAAAGMTDLELLDPARCRGWSRLDLVVHVRAGLDEMAATAGVAADAPIDHDAASYWELAEPDRDPVASIMWLRRRASAYQRPSSAVRHLADATHRAIATLAQITDRPVAFQGRVLSAGDFVATWVIELAVHQLDLRLPGQPPGSAQARQTLEAIAGSSLPEALDDRTAVLVGFDREPWPNDVDQPPGFPIRF